MEERKRDILQVALQSYVIEILSDLAKGAKRFKDLRGITHNDRILSLKLSRLTGLGLIRSGPIESKGKFANSYIITSLGKKVLKALDKVRIG
jgi:DNA-binding HxlR family transcriptional regulator